MGTGSELTPLSPCYLSLARYLYPFLEAEIAAKSLAVAGSESRDHVVPPAPSVDGSSETDHAHHDLSAPQSTFSGYTSGTLHDAYRKLGKTADTVDAL
jgi:hypothetical protein